MKGAGEGSNPSWDTRNKCLERITLIYEIKRLGFDSLTLDQEKFIGWLDAGKTIFSTTRCFIFTNKKTIINIWDRSSIGRAAGSYPEG